jgi:hypothetical protein
MVEIDSVATIIDTSETVRMIVSTAVTPDPKRHRRYPPRTFILAASHSAARTLINQQGRASSVLLDFDRPCGLRTSRTGNDGNLKGFNGV